MSNTSPVITALPKPFTIGRMTLDTPATIPNGTALSESIDKRGLSGGSVQFPATWTAANMAFKVSNDGTNFFPLKDATGILEELAGLPTAAGEGRALPDDLYAFNYFKLWSQTAGSDVNQGADRVFAVTLVA